MRRLLLFPILLTLFSSVQAATIAGIQIQPEARGIGGDILKLNGAGIRDKFIFDIYVAALYLPAPTQDPLSVITSDVTKRLEMHFVYKKVEREKIVQGWLDGFTANLAPAEYQELRPHINLFNTWFQDMKRGDTIVFEYLPSQGTHVIVNHEQKGVIEGHQFQQALLKIWLGSKPVKQDLKLELLGIQAPN